jgi:hypothetical protein
MTVKEHKQSSRDLYVIGLICTLSVATLSCRPGLEEAPASPTASKPEVLTGEYLGQKPPGMMAELFAPGLVSTGLSERDMAITPDGTEIYFTAVLGSSYTFSAIVGFRQIDGHWQGPAVASFSGNYMDLEPTLSADGQQMFFVSRRPAEGSGEPVDHEDIWVVGRVDDGWSTPKNLGAPINTPQPEFFPSVTRDGTLYFTRKGEDQIESIYRSRLSDGVYGEPEKLGPQVNSAQTQFNAFIAPDESYLIVCLWGAEDSLGGSDYYIVFRSPQDEWSNPINLGPVINTAEGQEWSPYISPDGKYFFFMASRSSIDNRYSLQRLTYDDLQHLHSGPMNGNFDIWWVDAEILEQFRLTG